jgi:hypothetical protein
MTVCNMSIEGGARCGYVNPDQTTYDYLKGREYAPKGANWDKAVAYWESIKSDAGRQVRRRGPHQGRGHPARGHLGHHARAVGVHRRRHPSGRDLHRRRARVRARGLRVHGLQARPAHRGHQDRRGLHRLVHQRPPVRLRGSGQGAQGRQVQGAAERARPGGAGFGTSAQRHAGARLGQGVQPTLASRSARPAARCAWP